MLHSIIKKTFSITFEFSSPAPHMTLTGRFCEYESMEDTLNIHIDLSPNIRTMFKQENTYLDALDLNTNRDKIAAFSIREDGVIYGILNVISKHEDKRLCFIFKLDKYPQIEIYGHVQPIDIFMRVIAIKQNH